MKLKKNKRWEKAIQIIPGGNMLYSKRAEAFLPDYWPTYYTKTKDCFVWDKDRNKYIDMIFAVGTNVLGYNNSKLEKDVIKAVKKGNMSTLNSYEEVQLTEELLKIDKWAGMVKYARTGAEANSIAIRIAKSYQKYKPNIAACGYHGWHDWYLAANLKDKNNLNSHLMSGLDPLGVPSNLKNTSFGFQYNNINELKKLIDKENIGVIKMEVSRSTQPNIKFLREVRELATKKNIILIFDECTSGFRQCFGGLHKLTKINPDMAIFGKALGNGYAITAILGKQEVMDSAQKSFMSSTFWSEKIGPVAAIKTLEIMEKEKSWKKITYLGNKLIFIWKNLSKKHQLKIDISGLPSLAKFNFMSKNSQAYKTFITQEMLKFNFLAANSVYLSISHDEKILKKYSESLDEIFYKISECEKGNLNIFDILQYPVAYTKFGRLN